MRLISIVIPTRHRPDFVREALYYATRQCGDYEIVVSDNYIDPALSVRGIVDEIGASSIRYLRPPQPLGMVDNWNFALSKASGDYVLFFTDKTFLLPGAVARLQTYLDTHMPDIVNWTADSFTPLRQDRPFSTGIYTRVRRDRDGHPDTYKPLAALSFKGRGVISRSRMSAIDYVKGKVCFGGYSRRLIAGIQAKYGELFKPIAPDYTSMILALSEAETAVDLGWSGAVQVSTNISNGMLCATDDRAARRFLVEVGGLESIMMGGIAPGLYASVSALVAFDYLTLKESHALPFEFERATWLAQAYVEMNLRDRVWSSQEAELDQRRCLDAAIDALSDAERPIFRNALVQFQVDQRPGAMVRWRRWLYRRLGGAITRSGLGSVFRLAARTGMLRHLHADSLRQAVASASGVGS